MRCKFDEVDPRSTGHHTSLFYLNNSVKKEILDFVTIYEENFKNKHQPNVHDVVGVLTGYSVVEHRGNFGGFYCKETKRIAYNSRGTACLDKTILHEIGHHIQFVSNNYLDCNKLWTSHLLHFERQAETISYYLYNMIFRKMPRDVFRSYFDASDVDYLYNYYNDWRPVQDDRHEYYERIKQN